MRLFDILLLVFGVRGNRLHKIYTDAGILKLSGQGRERGDKS